MGCTQEGKMKVGLVNQPNINNNILTPKQPISTLSPLASDVKVSEHWPYPLVSTIKIGNTPFHSASYLYIHIYLVYPYIYICIYISISIYIYISSISDFPSYPPSFSSNIFQPRPLVPGNAPKRSSKLLVTYSYGKWTMHIPIGSMVLVYMLTWLGYIDGIHVTIIYHI